MGYVTFPSVCPVLFSHAKPNLIEESLDMPPPIDGFPRLRPRSLGDHTGTDGLRLGSFVEAEIWNDGIELARMPTMLVMRGALARRGINTSRFFQSRQ